MFMIVAIVMGGIYNASCVEERSSDPITVKNGGPSIPDVAPVIQKEEKEEEIEETTSCAPHVSTEDLEHRIESLELLVSELRHDRGGAVRLQEVMSVIERGVVRSVDFVRKKIEMGAPETDNECSYDYIVGRCTPACDCKLQPKLGDFSLGRMCRLLDKLQSKKGSEMVPPCHPDEFDNSSWIARLSRRVVLVVKQVVAHIMEHAPASDPECKFEWLQLKCSKGCQFFYLFGDYSLDRICRKSDDQDSNGIESSEGSVPGKIEQIDLDTVQN